MRSRRILWLSLLLAGGCAAEKANGRPWIHDLKLEGDALLTECNLGLGAEHAERTGVQFHAITLTCACRPLRTT